MCRHKLPARSPELQIVAPVVFYFLLGVHGFNLAEELAHGTSPVIVVPGNHSVASGFAGYLEHPLELNRNITVTGADGVNTVLDLQFLHGVVKLCSTCTFTLDNITIANERRGNGSPVDFFVGQPAATSIVHLHNIHRLRLACASGPDSAFVVDNTPRSRVLPNATKHQIFNVSDYAWNGRVFPKTLSTEDYTADIPFQLEEGRGSQGGYALSAVNMHRLCLNIVPDSCLAVKAPEVCVDALIEQLLTGQQGAVESKDMRPPAAAIAAPVVIACTVLVAAAVGVIWVRRRQRQQSAADATKSVDACAVLSSNAETSRTTPADCASNRNDHDVEEGLKPASSLETGPRKGWTATTSLMCPSMGDVKDNTIQLGDLLGAGSYGRVYKARWNSRDVAVKVIQHDTAKTQQVENEVQLMMSLEHECIVRPYYFVTYVKHNGASEACSSVATGRVRGRHRLSLDAQVAQRTSSSSQYIRQPHPVAAASSDSVTLDMSASGMSGTVLDSGAIQTAELGVGSSLGLSPAAAATGAAATAVDSTGSTAAAVGSTGSIDSQQQTLGGQHAHSGDLAEHIAAAAACSGPIVSSVEYSRCTSYQGCVYTASQTSLESSALVAGTDAAHSADSSGNAVTSETGTEGQQGDAPRQKPATLSHKAESHLVMEYCDCGTLEKLVAALKQQQQQKSRKDQPLQDSPSNQQQEQHDIDAEVLLPLVLPLLHDVAHGLQLLHSQNIVHGDLNARNVLVSSASSAAGGFTAKLADFGLSRTIQQHRTHRTTKACGTLSHMPPEVLRDSCMSPAVDIYAFAVMMWELLTGETAFKKLHYGGFYQAVVLNNLRPRLPHNMPADCTALMQQCWAAEPGARPTADQVREAVAEMIAARGSCGTSG